MLDLRTAHAHLKVSNDSSVVGPQAQEQFTAVGLDWRLCETLEWLWEGTECQVRGNTVREESVKAVSVTTDVWDVFLSKSLKNRYSAAKFNDLCYNRSSITVLRRVGSNQRKPLVWCVAVWIRTTTSTVSGKMCELAFLKVIQSCSESHLRRILTQCTIANIKPYVVFLRYCTCSLCRVHCTTLHLTLNMSAGLSSLR